MSALIIIMLWVSLALAIEFFNERKEATKPRKIKKVQRKVYDFDLMAYEDDFSQLKKSA